MGQLQAGEGLAAAGFLAARAHLGEQLGEVSFAVGAEVELVLVGAALGNDRERLAAEDEAGAALPETPPAPQGMFARGAFGGAVQPSIGCVTKRFSTVRPNRDKGCPSGPPAV